MKKLLILLLLVPSLSLAKLISIKDYINQTTDFDADAVQYLNIRCFALVSYLSGATDNLELINEQKDMRSVFVFYFVKTRQEINTLETEDESISYFTKQVKMILDEMFIDGEKHYNETSTIYEKSLKEDYKMCKLAYNQLKTTNSL